MPSRICKSFRVFVALGILSVPAAWGETAPIFPVTTPALSIARIVADLESKEKALAAELVSTSLSSQKKEVNSEDAKRIASRMSASAEIGQCLLLRKSLAANPVVPTDPLYRAYRRCNLLEFDLQAAVTWWKYCKAESNNPALSQFVDWPLAIQLKSDFDRANAELAALRPEKGADAIPSSGSAEPIKLNPSLTRHLGDAKGKLPSILDQIDGWGKLPEAQKSKFISR